MQNVISISKVPGLVSTEYNNQAAAHKNVFTQFINWCGTQDEKRFMWLALTLFGLIGVALPCTLFSIVFLGGNNFNLWILACIINVPSLVVNLAAQSTKITLPALFFAWITDAVIIISCAVTFILNH